MRNFILTLAILFINLCNINSSNNYSNITHTSYSKSSEVNYINNGSEISIDINTYIEYPVLTNEYQNKNFLNFLRKCLCIENRNEESVKDIINNYHQSKIKETKNEVVEYEWVGRSLDETISCKENGFGFIVYDEDEFNYWARAAHPNNSRRCYMYDLYSNKQITISSIFKEEYIPIVLRLIKSNSIINCDKELIEDYRYYVDENLDYDMIDINSFFCDQSGIHWICYDVHHYMGGHIELILPYNIIEKYFIENTPIKRIYK